MADVELLTVPANCAKCGQAVTLECDPSDPWLAQDPAQQWPCPACNAPNDAKVPGLLLDVWLGHGPDPG